MEMARPAFLHRLEVMMIRSLRLASALVIALCAVALTHSTSAAANAFGLELFGTWNTVAMSDWNDQIDAANASGTNYDNIKNGYSFGVGPTLNVNGTWEFGAHYERLTAAETSDAGTQITVSPVANAFGVSAAYLFPSQMPMRFGLQAGVDMMHLASKLSDPTTDQDIEGSGVGFQFGGLARYAFNPSFSGQFSVGYRAADIDVESIGGQDPTGSGLESEDYSGVVLRAAFSIHQPSR
jgi:hypothetical protein